MTDRYVNEVMSRPVRTTSPGTPVREAAGQLIERDVGSLVVLEEGRLVGILTATDLVRHVANAGAEDAVVGDYMRTAPMRAGRDSTLAEVRRAMADHRIHHLPVVEGNEVVGVVSSLDLALAARD